MKRLYRDKQWFEFRQTVLEMDGFTCVKCKRSPPEVVLQVHHKQYFAGKAPWDYALENCETLCRGCHAREHGEIRPSDGWSLYAQDDLGGLDGSCECCGTALRHVFYIQHEKWEPLAVGTVCCDDLTGTTEATDHRKHLDRKKRFLSSSRWKKGRVGQWIEQGKALLIEIRPDGVAFRISMNGVKGLNSFDSLLAAKEHVFRLISSGEAKKFSKRHPRKFRVL